LREVVVFEDLCEVFLIHGFKFVACETERGRGDDVKVAEDFDEGFDGEGFGFLGSW
jgi:predicted small secreted protein